MKKAAEHYGFIFLFALISLAFVWVLYLLVIHSSLDFDGAYEAIAARYFANTGLYGTVTYGRLSPMDVGLSTGPTVVFPVALVFKLFGVSMNKAMIVSAVYLVLLFWAVFIFNLQYVNKWFSLILAVIFLTTPLLFNYGIGMLGEVPAAFFLTLSVLSWSKLTRPSKCSTVWCIILGASIYLAFLTKMICGIFSAVLAVFLLLDFFLTHTIRKKDFLWIILSAFAVMIAFEVFKFIELGGTFHAYKHWFREALSGIISLNKVTPGSTGVRLSLTLLKDRTNTLILNAGNKYYIYALLTAFPAYFIYLAARLIIRLKNGGKISEFARSIPFPMVVTGCGGYAFLLYWYFVCLDSVLWYRRIYPGLVMLTIFTVWLFSYCIGRAIRFVLCRGQKWPARIAVSATGTVAILLLAVVARSNLKLVSIPTKPSFLLNGVTGICNYVNALPTDSALYGVGFWENPQVEFVTGRHVKDLNAEVQNGFTATRRDRYIIVDYYYYNLDSSWKNIENNYNVSKVYDRNDYIIYRLNSQPVRH